MRRLLIVAIMATACDSATEPQVAGPRAERAIVHNGVPYPEVDAQIARLYAFNNCLTGLDGNYQPSLDCPVVDMTYEVASGSNEALANVFPQGFVVDATASRAWLATYLQTIDLGNQLGRVSCRARFALRKVSYQVDSLLLAIQAATTLDYSGLPQPLHARIIDTSPFDGSGCAPEVIPAAVAPAGGYSVFAFRTACNGADRSIEINRDSSFMAHAVHSNARLRVSGDENYIVGAATFACGSNISGANYFDDGPTQVATRITVPVDTALTCTYSRIGNWILDNNGPHWVGGSNTSRTLNPGTYCSTGTITLDTDYVRGTVTLRAGGTITITALAPTLRAYDNDLLFFSRSNSASAVRVTGMWPSFAGHLYAPRGRVDLTGADHASINGSVLANRVRIQADAVNIY